MYGASQEQLSATFGPVSNFPSAIQNTTHVESQTSARGTHGATVESILHKLQIVLFEKK
jgi:hypothetical protein